MKRLDLTGQAFGQLTVIRKGEPYISPSGYKKPRWICQCECGRFVQVFATNLLNGRTNSCGYKRHKKHKHFVSASVDLTGCVFGHLTVIGETTPYVSPKRVTKVVWLCQCDCGRVIRVMTHNLLAGISRSCGHARLDYLKDKGPVTSLVGKHFGHLTVLKDDGTRTNKEVMWLCQCDCGNLAHVSGSNLVTGNTISCGHIGKKALIDYQAKVKRDTPGTRLDSLGTKPNKNNKLNERNISIYHKGKYDYYRVAVMYKRHQYGGLRDTLEEAIKLREELRHKYWPNYNDNQD